MTDTKIDLKALKAAVKEGPPVLGGGNSLEGRIRRLPDAEFAELVTSILNDPSWSKIAAANVLTRAGFKVSDSTVRSYRLRNGIPLTMDSAA